MSGLPAVFLDRDGTLIDQAGYLGDPAGVSAFPGVREALTLLEEKGWLRLVATNQSGVARGLFSVADYRAVERAVGDAVGGVDDRLEILGRRLPAALLDVGVDRRAHEGAGCGAGDCSPSPL